MDARPGGVATVLVLLALSGCAAFARSEPIVYWDPRAPRIDRPLVVEPAVNATGFALDPDIAGTVADELRTRLRDRNLIRDSASGSTADAIAVRTFVIAYDPGNAVQRWAAPGWGTTYCTLRTTLVDQRTGETVGEIVVDKSVGVGGFYTVGADRWIVGATVDEIADEIARKLGTEERP